MTKNPNSVYKIRFSDCDLLGHLNNARYIDYFMNAREDHLKHYGIKLTDYYYRGIAWVVSSHEIAYLRPAVYDEVVSITSSLVFAEKDSLFVELSMSDEAGKNLKSVMWTRFTPINPKTGRKENHGDDFMALAKTIEIRPASFPDTLESRIKELRSLQKETV